MCDRLVLQPRIDLLLDGVESEGARAECHCTGRDGVPWGESGEQTVTTQPKRVATETGDDINKARQYSVGKVDNFIVVVPESPAREVCEIEENRDHFCRTSFADREVVERRMTKCARFQ